jgi:hypothetical protein
MNATVQAAIDAELALLERVVDPPSAPHGYGSDLSCTDDLTATMDEVNGFTTLALAQALVRRLDCPRGGLPDDPDYGIDIRAMLNRGLTTRELRDLAGAVRLELEKDERVDSASVTFRPAPDGSSFAIEIAVTPIDARLGTDGEGGFSLTLALTDAALLLEELR